MSGIVLWMAAGIAAFALTRWVAAGRKRSLSEASAALLAALLCGALATALDFGGWREVDWRAGLFAFIGSLAAIGLLRMRE